MWWRPWFAFSEFFFRFGLSAWVFYFNLLLCYIVLYLFVLLFDSVEFPECEACYYESLAFEDRQPGKSFDHVFYNTYDFIALELYLPTMHAVGEFC